MNPNDGRSMTGRHRQPEKPIKRGDTSILPPMPDSETGHPEPPMAPGFQGAAGKLEDSPVADTRTFRKPQPPPECGPTLSWYRENARAKALLFFIAAGILFVGFAAISWLDDGDWMWFRFWQLWIVLVVGAYLMSRPLDLTTTSVGADWYQRNHRKRWYQRRARRNHLMIYELTRIEGTFAGASYHLYLEDADERGMHLILDDLQPSRKIWNLVYNGIQHSIANGADIDRTAIWLLSLQDSPALQQHNEE